MIKKGAVYNKEEKVQIKQRNGNEAENSENIFGPFLKPREEKFILNSTKGSNSRRTWGPFMRRLKSKIDSAVMVLNIGKYIISQWVKCVVI